VLENQALLSFKVKKNEHSLPVSAEYNSNVYFQWNCKAQKNKFRYQTYFGAVFNLSISTKIGMAV
jgi:hypothetical protein